MHCCHTRGATALHNPPKPATEPSAMLSVKAKPQRNRMQHCCGQCRWSGIPLSFCLLYRGAKGQYQQPEQRWRFLWLEWLQLQWSKYWHQTCSQHSGKSGQCRTWWLWCQKTGRSKVFETCRFYNLLGSRPTNLQQIYKLIYIYKKKSYFMVRY